MRTDFKYYILYKPFGMLSQFTGEKGQQTLGDLNKFPKDVYPVGRLDADSEGLLILTNDSELNQKLLEPAKKHNRTYLVQVEGSISNEAILALCEGLNLTIDGMKYRTLPAKVNMPESEPVVPERNPPIRFRKSIPTSWIELTLIEGKNRQVRRMTAKTGFPTLRLIRIAIGNLNIGNMKPGEVKEMDGKELLKLLNG
jgi:23S rRNA pseudouridine2457 synthase